MSSLAFFLMVLHISAYSIRFLLSPFSAISRRFVIRARVGDNIVDFSGLLVALATVDALCWITSVVVSLMVSTSFSSNGVSNRFLSSSWNFIFFEWHLVLIASWSYIFSLSTSTSSLMLLITNVDLADDCYVCDDIWPVFRT